jgi:hypothetical protein
MIYCARNLIENRVGAEHLGETTWVETEGTHNDPGVYSTVPDTPTARCKA